MRPVYISSPDIANPFPGDVALLDSKHEQPENLYTLLERIGSGSFGEVYKALELATRDIVAIKRITIEPGEALSEVLQEVAFLKECQHPHIVEYRATHIRMGSIPGQKIVWIVMEYCGGGSVESTYKMQNAPLAEPEIAAVLTGCLQGLAYLHSKRKMHRDIKAGNILLTDGGVVKLADFGVAVQLSKTFAKRNTFIGTPFWMSPEVITTEQKGTVYDDRADIWSVGITAIEMAQCAPPLFDLHPMRALFLIPKLDSPELENKDDWSPAFHDFIRTTLSKDPERRPSAKQLLTHPFLNAFQITKSITSPSLNLRPLSPSASATGMTVELAKQLSIISSISESATTPDQRGLGALNSTATSTTLTPIPPITSPNGTMSQPMVNFHLPSGQDILILMIQRALEAKKAGVVAASPGTGGKRDTRRLTVRSDSSNSTRNSNPHYTRQKHLSLIHQASPTDTFHSQTHRSHTSGAILEEGRGGGPGSGAEDGSGSVYGGGGRGTFGKTGTIPKSRSPTSTVSTVPPFKATRLCRLDMQVNCADVYKDSLLIGTNSGCFFFDVVGNKITTLSANRKYHQLTCLEEFDMILSRSGKYSTVCIHSSPTIASFTGGAISKAWKDASQKLPETVNCIMYSVSKEQKFLYLCVLVKGSILLYKWTPAPIRRFMKVRSFPSAQDVHGMRVHEMGNDIRLIVAKPTHFQVWNVQTSSFEEVRFDTITVPRITNSPTGTVEGVGRSDSEGLGIPIDTLSFRNSYMFCLEGGAVERKDLPPLLLRPSPVSQFDMRAMLMEGERRNTVSASKTTPKPAFQWRKPCTFCAQFGQEFIVSGCNSMVDVYCKENGKIVHVFEIKDKLLSLLSCTETKLYLLAVDTALSVSAASNTPGLFKNSDSSKKPNSSIIQIVRN